MQLTTDKVFLITGAAGGIAGAIIDTFAAAGARLALADLDFERVEERARGIDATPFEIDLSDPAATAAMVAEAQEHLGAIDGVIHTTGGFATASAEESDNALYDSLFDRNVRTLVNTSRAVLPHFMRRQAGFLAGFSAAPGWQRSGGAGMSLYAAAKAAVAAYLHALQEELGTHGIAVAVVYPLGVVETPANRESMPNADRSRWIDPAEIGRALLAAALSGPRGRLLELPVFPAP